jgi:hypothetical protein
MGNLSSAFEKADTSAYTVKKGSRVSRLQLGCHVTNQTPPGQEQFSYDVIIPAQGEFGRDIPAGDGNSRTFFLRCIPLTR